MKCHAFALVVAALLAFASCGRASPALAKPTHLISVGTRSFRCQCDPTAVAVDFSGECLSSDFTRVTSSCSALADNCVCTEILHLVRRGCEPLADRNDDAEVAEFFDKMLVELDVLAGRTPIKDPPPPLDMSMPMAKADSSGDALFSQMREDLGTFKVDMVAKKEAMDKSMAELGPKMDEAISSGCKAMGECEYFGIPDRRIVEFVARSPVGDFDIQLKTTENSPENIASNGLAEAELRKIFTNEFSGFTLEEKIGQGSFGVVFKASALGGISEMAIKFVRMDVPVAVNKELAINNGMLRVFANTRYEPLFSLPQGLIKIKRPGRDDQLALVFDKMDMDAFDYVKQRLPSNFEFLYNIGATMFHGIRVMGDAGFVHADIKLENVLFTPAKEGRQAEARLADFGLSRRISDIAKDKKIGGTISYASPEMFFDRVQNTQSDVWAAGVTLYTAAVGRHPFGVFPKTTRDMTEGMFHLLGAGAIPQAFLERLGPMPKPTLAREFLAKTITLNEGIPMPKRKRAELADLLESIFVADPAARASAGDIVNHPFFATAAD